MTLQTESEIQNSYSDPTKAQEYVEQRFTSELMALLHERQVAAVNRVMHQQQPHDALEIAPGPGRLTRDVRPAGRLVCLEFNEAMIDVGRSATTNGAEWMQGNAFELPFSEEFDFAYSFRFIRHFKREDRERLYKQIRGTLKPGGTLVMDAVNAVVSKPLRDANPEGYPIYDKLYETEDELRAEQQEAGFEVVSIDPVQRWFGPQCKAQILLGPRSRLLCRMVIRTLERLRRGPALEWIVTCRRA